MNIAMRSKLPNHERRAFVAGLSLALIGVTGLALAQSPAASFDHRHGAWDALLKQHVMVAASGNASTLRYAALQAQRPALKAYLDTLSAVSAASYGAWSRSQQLAFLINAYNAFTVELILTRYPDLKSIKDLGGFLQSPWKKKFFQLLGQERSLDEDAHRDCHGGWDALLKQHVVVAAGGNASTLRYAALQAQRPVSSRSYCNNKRPD